MTTPTANLERERLLKLAEEYRSQGYEVLFHPNSEDLPDFLGNFRPDMIARREDKAVIIEVKSRSSLNSSSTHHLRHLAQVVEQHPDWRFELVMSNPEEAANFPKAANSLQKTDIESRLQEAKEIATQYPGAAILTSWALLEATMRLIADYEGLNLKKFEARYLIKQLVTEGVISRSEYQLLTNAFSLRNSIAHGFEPMQPNQESVDELINITEQLLKTLDNYSEKA